MMKVLSLKRSAIQIAISLAILTLAVCSPAQQPTKTTHTAEIDFSFAGYGAGRALPIVKAALRVEPSGSDDTELIQCALDTVAARPMGADGFRGAVALTAGRFHVSGQLQMRASGVVLRGAGVDKTIVVAEGISRRALIVMGGRVEPSLTASIPVTEDAFAGSRQLHLGTVDGLKAGMQVVVIRQSTEEWISALGMKDLPGNFASIRLDWKPGSRDLEWDRTIVAVDEVNHSVELDAPVTTALEARWGGGTLGVVKGDDAAERIGVEQLSLESSFDRANSADEEHAWIGVQMDHLRDGWVRQMTARHFVSSAVRVNSRGRRITIVDCKSLEPVSEKAGYRRQSFVVNGQQTLVARCFGEEGMNDFASGMLAGGPNVFLDCLAQRTLGASGAFESWASGVLYEQVKVPESRIQLIEDFDRAEGAGWTAANSVIWNSTAQSVVVLGAPGAPNRVVESEEPLFATQLKRRTGLSLDDLFGSQSDASQSDAAAELFHVDAVAAPAAVKEELHPVEISGGRFVVDGHTAWGESQTEAWWKAELSPWTAPLSTGSSVTRFNPGVTAHGETEDLAAMAARLKSRGVLTIQVNPGLWYDRRRDGHTDERRANADVWAPFYESPWARSAQGVAWDGLSRYDLSRYNPWYFSRQREFAHEAAKQGLLIFYDLYNTHNVLEIGPHWMDYAWRPANNINNTGLPEPPPLDYDNRNDLANEFYSTTNVALRELHRAYIVHTLDELGDQPNLIFGLAYQYAGPLSFEQFFLDTIADWEQKHGKHVRVALTTSKASTDAVLSDPIRGKQIAVVDMRYWQYQPDGTLFAPAAGINTAFRAQIIAQFPGSMDVPPQTTERLAYRSIREYRDRYPEIALMPMENGGGPVPMLMAGAAAASALHPRPSAELLAASAGVSCPPTADAIPRNCAAPNAKLEQASDAVVRSVIFKYLCGDLMRMEPKDGWTRDPETTWTLAENERGPVLIYSLAGDSIRLLRTVQTKSALWINPRSGEEREGKVQITGKTDVYRKPDAGEWLLLLR